MLKKKSTQAAAAKATVDLDGAAGPTWSNSADGYELKFQIGEGAFAKVYQARALEKGIDVAIKIIELDNLSSSLNDIYQEVRVMKLCKYEHVLSSYACFVVKRDLWLVMPLMRKGSCLRIMRHLKMCGQGEGLKENWIATILKSALLGLQYFHNQGQVHRDIKASNLLMDSDGSVKLSDFGVAGWVKQPGDRTSERRTFVGTPCWMAPEVMEQADAYDEKADIWSFGITALELAKGYAPYARLNPMTVMIQTIREDPPSFKTYEDYAKTKGNWSSNFTKIITMCLQKNPKMRPSATTLLSKAFFKKAEPPSVLVRDLLEATPIPDTKSIERRPVKPRVDAAGDLQTPMSKMTVTEGGDDKTGKGIMANLREKGTSFVQGATWIYDDEPPKDNGGKEEDGLIDFEEFEQMYSKSSVKDEEGLVAPAAAPEPAQK